jgi:hypothetical protein
MLSRVHRILEPGGEGIAAWIPVAIQGLIIANVAAVILETVPRFRELYGDYLGAFEWTPSGSSLSSTSRTWHRAPLTHAMVLPFWGASAGPCLRSRWWI